MTGTPTVGSKLKCLPGTWTGHPEPIYTYQWLHEGATIELQTTNEYTVETRRRRLQPRVQGDGEQRRGVRPGGEQSVHVTANEPINEEKPRVEGLAEPEVGEALTCSPGVWNDKPTFTYQWLREGSPIASATASIYTASREDVSHRLTCQVTATNSEGKSAKPVVSSNSVRVHGSKPENTKLPEITPHESLEPGKVVTCLKGSWSGVPAPDKFSYSWVLVEPNGEKTALSATGERYTILDEDRGDSLFCEVTAINEIAPGIEGKTVAASAPVVVPEHKTGGERPENKTPPKVEDISDPANVLHPKVGERLECEKGLWSGGNPPPMITYKWLRGESVVAVGEHEERYEVTEADRAHSLSCVVAETNTEGTASVPSSNSPYVFGEQPTVVVPPNVSGNGLLKETLTCSQGEWSAVPAPTYTYRWLRGEMVIASGASYVVTTQDRGYSLTCEVIAENSEGKSEAKSGNSVHIPGEQPKSTSAPELSGNPEVGGTLKCSLGKWSGAPTPSYEYQWLLNGVSIPGARTETFTITRADRGRAISCKVTATNVEGIASAASQAVDVPGFAPENIEETPNIAGHGVAGEILKCERGFWEGAPAPSFKYQWLVNGTIVASSQGDEYTPEASEVGESLYCNVVAENTEGKAEAPSNSVQISAAPGRSAHQLVEQTTSTKSATVTPPPAATATAAEIRSALTTQLRSAQHGARIATILKHGYYTFTFSAPAAGTLELSWYELSKADTPRPRRSRSSSRRSRPRASQEPRARRP